MSCHNLLIQLHQSIIIQNTNLIEILGAKSTKSSFTSITRGLYTKYSKLSSLLDKAIKQTDSVEVFKNFVNDFILWVDDDVLTLFAKYSEQWKLEDTKLYTEPIEGLAGLIEFITCCDEHLRNPFVLGRLNETKNKLQQIIDNHHHDIHSKKLNNINFSKIQYKHEMVSSYFTADQIMERTDGTDLYMDKTPVELVLLDLVGTGIYNAVAILSIEESSRSLLYPPFRINELSLSHTTNSVDLKPIDFLSTEEDHEVITITCDDSDFLDSWVEKLSTICPLERNDSPVSLLEHTPPPELSGFGINVISDSEHQKSMSSEETLQPITPKQEFKELISSPTISPKYNHIIRKTLSEDDLQIVNRKKVSEEHSEKHVSCVGEIVAPEGPYQNTSFASSVPNIRPMYQLSTGSAIDIHKFGQSYQPSFTMNKPKRRSIFGLFKKSSKTAGFETVTKPEKKAVQEPKPKPQPSTINEIETTSDETAGFEKVTKANTTPGFETVTRPKLKSEQNSSSSIPGPFAPPSLFKQYSSDIIVPQDLKDTINEDSTIDFYVSESSSPRSLKISEWKQQKWEMITVAEKLFVKISINYEKQKCWFMIFKEEEEEDKPVLLMNVSPGVSEIRKSSALDLQLNLVNAITQDKLLIMIRCANGILADEIVNNLRNAMGAMKSSMKLSKSDATLQSSMMEHPSKSSSLSSLDVNEVYNAAVVYNPTSFHVKRIDQMRVRLQKQLCDYDSINIPSSWEILSMCTLTIDEIMDDKRYFHFKLTGDKSYDWLVADESKTEVLEKIGRAGLLVKHPGEIFMIECKGKKEFKIMYI
ncbi:hypothetical protein SBY92_005435 [Candida maltosa Xu316]